MAIGGFSRSATRSHGRIRGDFAIGETFVGFGTKGANSNRETFAGFDTGGANSSGGAFTGFYTRETNSSR